MRSSHLRESDVIGVGCGVSNGIFKHSPGVSHVWSSLTASALDIVTTALDVPVAPLSHKASLFLSCSFSIRLTLQKTPPDTLPVSQHLIVSSGSSTLELINSSSWLFQTFSSLRPSQLLLNSAQNSFSLEEKTNKQTERLRKIALSSHHNHIQCLLFESPFMSWIYAQFTYPVNWLWKWPFSCLSPQLPTLLDYSLCRISCCNGPISRKASGAHFPVAPLILCLSLQVRGMTCLLNSWFILLGPLTCVWTSWAFHLSQSTCSTSLLWGRDASHRSTHVDPLLPLRVLSAPSSLYG